MATEQVRPGTAQRVDAACPLDCPDACSLEIDLEGGRVVKIDGSRINPVTQGFICAKVRGYADHLYGDARLRFPALRRGAKGEGRFERVSWDEALGTVAERLREVRARFGGEAILPLSYGGSNGFLSQDTTDARLFRRLGASRLLRTVCAAPTGRAAEGLYGEMPGVAYPDYAQARLIVIWGANPNAAGIHLVPYVYEAQRKGAKLVVVDPRRTPLARRADLHLTVRPGTDLVLALAMIRWLFANGRADEAFLAAHTTGAQELRRRAEPWTLEKASSTTGLAAADIEGFAKLYADTRPALVRCGWGLERNRNGGSAAAAVLALPAVAGAFGVRGGGYTLSNSAAWDLSTEEAIRAPEAATRAVNMNEAGRALAPEATPPVKLLFVYNCNPAMTLPEQERVLRGLRRDDLFTVVSEQVMTDTARYADVILPASTFLERREISKGYGAFVLQDRGPVIEPVGEARANHEVFAELVRRTGLHEEGDPETAEELARAMYASSARRGDIAESLGRRGFAAPGSGEAPVQFVDVFPRTADGKVHLVPEVLDREAPEGLYRFRREPEGGPLVLISPSTEKRISSTLGQLHRGRVPLEIHPEDAAPRGIQDGDRVRVFNALGEVRGRARVTAEVRPGVVSLPKGLWSHNTDNGLTSNALCPDTLADLGGGACFNDARVEVARAG
jgi:anaerobic selenocysteine-containing dehydrogenase